VLRGTNVLLYILLSVPKCRLAKLGSDLGRGVVDKVSIRAKGIVWCLMLLLMLLLMRLEAVRVAV